MILSINPRAHLLSKGEQDDFDAVVGGDARATYSIAPDLGRTNWATFPLVRFQNRETGRALTYYRHPSGRPRYWVSQFSKAMEQ